MIIAAAGVGRVVLIVVVCAIVAVLLAWRIFIHDRS
jgi:hypothetical protein